jgi:hypothetical protein
MAQSLTCDRCKQTAPLTATSSWLSVRSAASDYTMNVFGGGRSVKGDYCSPRCLADAAVDYAESSGHRLTNAGLA